MLAPFHEHTGGRCAESSGAAGSSWATRPELCALARGRVADADADLLKRVFEIDVLTCPYCGGRRKLIALLTDGAVVRLRRGRAKQLPWGILFQGLGEHPNPASQVTTDLERPPRPGSRRPESPCEPYREAITAALEQGRNAKAIWQDLVDQHAFPRHYESVKRYVRRLRGSVVSLAHPTIMTAPGEEAQVDYGDGPMVRHPETGKYRRTRLFALTLGWSRKTVWLLTWKSSRSSLAFGLPRRGRFFCAPLGLMRRRFPARTGW